MIKLKGILVGGVSRNPKSVAPIHNGAVTQHSEVVRFRRIPQTPRGIEYRVSPGQKYSFLTGQKYTF